MAYLDNLTTWVTGQKLTATSLTAEFGKVRTVAQDVNLRLNALEGASGPLTAADAADNMTNMLVNGSFWSRYGSQSTLEASEQFNYYNATLDTYAIQHCPGWFLKGNIECDASGFDGGVSLSDISGDTSGDDGQFFQRLDYFYPITEMRGRTMTVAVAFATDAASLFQLRISDGVNTTTTLLADAVDTSGSTAVLQISHTIANAATKLTVELVIPDGTTFTTADSLRITRIFAKLGTGTITLNSGVHPAQFSVDEARLKSICNVWISDESYWFHATEQDPTGASGEFYTKFFPPGDPLVTMESGLNDLVQNFAYTDAAALPTSLAGATVLFTNEEIGTRNITGSIAQSLVQPFLSLSRTDGEPGFTVDQAILASLVIPQP